MFVYCAVLWLSFGGFFAALALPYLTLPAQVQASPAFCVDGLFSRFSFSATLRVRASDVQARNVSCISVHVRCIVGSHETTLC